ncbi:MAG TPA: class I SAM-dependent methyltransferase [Acetobacteraceae bacterium]|jgi:ubiquinone/menaquinone biosynthesis C-methylase UbiE|nr:class I SAM-dependent methyltransferase [Acetobacteraceae bacterium]
MASKSYIGMGMEGAVARWYQKNTAKDMEEFRRLAGRIASQLAAGSAVLEVAPGPGFLAVELARRGFAVTGLDISRTFVDLASKNARRANVDARFQQGNASRMPFPDRTFDFLVCRAAFKNFSDPIGALNEMQRVLKPGCRGLIIDLRRDAALAEIAAYVDGLGVSLFNRLVMKLVFRYMLLPRAWRTDDFARMLEQIPFRHTEIVRSAIGMDVWLDT